MRFRVKLQDHRLKFLKRFFFLLIWADGQSWMLLHMLAQRGNTMTVYKPMQLVLWRDILQGISTTFS